MFITFIDTQSNLVCATCDIDDWFDKVLEILSVSGCVNDETIEKVLCNIAVLQQSLGLLDGWTDVIRMLKPESFEEDPFYLSGKITESIINPDPNKEIVANVAAGSQNFIVAIQKKWPTGLARAMMLSAISSLEQLVGESKANE